MKKEHKKSHFKTPEGYFEGLTDRLLDKISDSGSQGKETLLPKKEGFTVPDGYFKDLHHTIDQKLKEKETQVVPLRSYKKYYYAVASIAALVLLVFGLQWTNSDTKDISFEGLASSDIEAYFEDYELGLTSYEIAQVIPVEELEINDILEDGLEQENIIDYLDNNIEDFEDLNFEDDEY
ncbi:MAG: hypothetical protein WBG90_22855 [Saonia sp.]